MNSVRVFCEGAFQTNTYICSVNSKSFVIDPAFILQKDCDAAISQINSCYSVLLTHNHLDHIRGLIFIEENTPVYLHEADYENLTPDYLKRAYLAYGSPLFKNDSEFNSFVQQIMNMKKRIIPVKDKDCIENTFMVMHTPGHTSGSVCFLKDDILFTGDTMFYNSYGRYDLESGSYSDLALSLKKLCTLPDETVIYPGHGDKSIIKYEKPLYRGI